MWKEGIVLDRRWGDCTRHEGDLHIFACAWVRYVRHSQKFHTSKNCYCSPTDIFFRFWKYGWWRGLSPSWFPRPPKSNVDRRRQRDSRDPRQREIQPPTSPNSFEKNCVHRVVLKFACITCFTYPRCTWADGGAASSVTAVLLARCICRRGCVCVERRGGYEV